MKNQVLDFRQQEHKILLQAYSTDNNYYPHLGGPAANKTLLQPIKQLAMIRHFSLANLPELSTR